MKRLRSLLLTATLATVALAEPPASPLFVNVDRIATMNVNGVRAELIAAGWKTIRKGDGGIFSKKPDGSSVIVDMWRGKPIQVIAKLAPPFPDASPELFRSVFGISVAPPPPDPFGPVGTGTSFHRGTDVCLTWNFKGTTRERIFGPVYEAETRRVGEECIVIVQLADRATMKRWENAR
jgi:hypothetical protein